MSRSGAATRSIGRFISEASPTRVLAKSCPHSSPMNRRMAVPALPMSSAALPARRPVLPTPWTTTVCASGCSMRTPSARSALKVARQSALSRNPVMRVMPSLTAPSISARCEIDLSPGTLTVPPTRATGATW